MRTSRLPRQISLLLLLTAILWTGCDNGIKLDESGELIIEDLQAGTGETAQEGTRVALHAVGTVLNGNGVKFTDSYATGRPFVFELGAGMVIEGWEEGLPGMKEGGRRRLTIPPRMAFGTREFENLPPNSTVVYDIELLAVDHPDSLGIQDVTVGNGLTAASGDSLWVRYTGYFGDGYVFDSSGSNMIRLKLGTTNVIQGWTLGLENMREGGHRRLIIPPQLGYGNVWQGIIPPGSTIIFDVYLITVKKQ